VECPHPQSVAPKAIGAGIRDSVDKQEGVRNGVQEWMQPRTLQLAVNALGLKCLLLWLQSDAMRESAGILVLGLVAMPRTVQQLKTGTGLDLAALKLMELELWDHDFPFAFLTIATLGAPIAFFLLTNEAYPYIPPAAQ